MRRLLSLLCCLPLVAAGQSLLERYAVRLTPPPVYDCRFTATPPCLDGVPDEACWQSAAAVRLTDIRGAAYPAPCYDTEVRMLWDSTCFYVAAVLTEPDLRARLRQRDTIIYHDNDFEIFIDPDGDGIRYFEWEVNALGTLFDLYLTHPYRAGGTFLTAWDCPGLRYAVHRRGTLNRSADRDTAWTVEFAIPHKALTVGFADGLQQGRCWRVNFSRVQHLMPGAPEENWVWAPTGVVDIHMPERWGEVRLLLPGEVAPPASDAAIRRLLWAVYYAEYDLLRERGTFAPVELSETDRATLPVAAQLTVETTARQFEITLRTADGVYRLTHDGHFTYEPQKAL